MVDSTKGPKRKIYRMTPAGRKALDRGLAEIDDVFNAISIVRKIDWTKVHERPKTK
jgi:DNA-binding PadR family transcriptional regulator